MAELLASATTASTSADFTVTAGTPVTLFLKSATTETLPADGSASIQIKSAGATYYPVGVLERNTPARVIDGPGTFRVVKSTGSVAFGVDKE